MRVKPNALIFVVLFVVYLAVVSIFWKANDFQYDDISLSVENVRNGIAIPVGVGAIFLAVAATVLGWWGPALKEPLRLTNKLAKLLPVVLVLGAGVNLIATDWENVTGEFGLWLVISVLLVGFSEEMLCRGLGLVGARGSFPELKAALFTAVMFGLLHVPNAFFGQSAKATFQQVIFATLFGIVYYTLRRATGGLIVPMLLHALWDGSLFVNDHSGADPAPTSNLLMILAIVFSFISLRHWWKSTKEAPQLATS